ncbi:CDP-glycerol glycerophosphotransferase family protein [Halanaerobium sp. Z-7514]|uniref:CDP-glycerol glycerophosphotransferase family protein n=1 Tax=Halanaerobium polyolivorans TaxID=2886943 RepID=A0AAW4X1H1_9FIRM|nr:CDP-glycerol glycerophosphotransferase family protein [Halanaerobium polyolivorans]MCC3145656.1 CDP-glycerol glycerophosphotransferase family protein [Halanaerobium polyolivorans]
MKKLIKKLLLYFGILRSVIKIKIGLSGLIHNPLKFIEFWLNLIKAIISNKKIITFYYSQKIHPSFTQSLPNKLSMNENIEVFCFCDWSEEEKLYNGMNKTKIYYNCSKILPLTFAHLLITPISGYTSKKPFLSKFAHVPHSLVSLTGIYKKNAFDYMDIFFASGPHHTKELKLMRNNRGWEDVKILPSGYPKVDELSKLKGNKKFTKNSFDTILYAPTWTEGLSLEECGYDIINELINNNYNVIFRPHPLSLKHQNKLIDNINKKFSDLSSYRFDKSNDSTESLLESDLMITDWSGVALEYSLAFEKPIIFIDGKKKIQNEEFYKYYNENDLVEVSYRNKLGKIIDSVENLNEEINDLKQTFDVTKVRKARDDLLYNYKNSEHIIKNQILNILEMK